MEEGTIGRERVLNRFSFNENHARSGNVQSYVQVQTEFLHSASSSESRTIDECKDGFFGC